MRYNNKHSRKNVNVILHWFCVEYGVEITYARYRSHGLGHEIAY